MRVVGLAVVLGAALSTAGCTSFLAPSRQGPFASNLRQSQQAEMLLAYYPEVGFVQGTRRVLAGLGSQLKPAAGLNRTVAACRKVLHGETAKLGAHDVQVVSAGPERADQGQLVGPVLVRIIYHTGWNSYQVRAAKVNCVMSPGGRVTSVKAV